MNESNNIEQQRRLISSLTILKFQLAEAGLYRTSRMMEIPIIEVGWEIQGVDTPEFQKERQQETLTP